MGGGGGVTIGVVLCHSSDRNGAGRRDHYSIIGKDSFSIQYTIQIVPGYSTRTSEELS